MNERELEALLRAAGETAGSAPRETLAADVRVAFARVRRRTARRRLAAALIGGYLTGALTIWAAMTPAAPRRPDARQVSATSADRANPALEREQSPRQEDTKLPQLILPVEEDQVSLYEILRQMGDESRLTGDLQSAVAYYGQALDAATPVERQISFDRDDWLLISLKKDRMASIQSPSQGDSI